MNEVDLEVNNFSSKVNLKINFGQTSEERNSIIKQIIFDINKQSDINSQIIIDADLIDQERGIEDDNKYFLTNNKVSFFFTENEKTKNYIKSNLNKNKNYIKRKFF